MSLRIVLTVTMLTTLRNSRTRLKDEKAANPATALYAFWVGYSARSCIAWVSWSPAIFRS